MEQYNIFLSVGGTANDKQESFLNAIEGRIRSENLIPNTVGRNKFGSTAPLKTILNLMHDCSGTVIIAFERTYFPAGIEKRGGSKAADLTETRFPTPWNQIEAGMAYSKGQPILVIVEKGLRNEGLLQNGYEWYVLLVDLELSSLTTPEFNGVFADWKEKVKKYDNEKKQVTVKRTSIDPAKLNIGELLKMLKPSDLWKILGAIAVLLAGAFTLGKFFG